MRKLSLAILIVAILMLIAVLVSLLPSDQWFVRTVDLVREPMSYLAAILLFIALFIKAGLRWLAVGALALVIAVNVWRIWPYSALAGTQVPLANSASDAGEHCFSAMRSM